VAYASPGYLLFVQHATLFAQRLNLEHLRLEGPRLVVAEQVNVDPGSSAPFSASENGMLAYHGGAAFRARNQLAWYDRRGSRIEASEPGQY
jgi:hypothetical protein